MLYYEVLTHLYTIQRLKRAQGLAPDCILPRVGYLTFQHQVLRINRPSSS